ncbi:prephenate/arogenate dehydrogenase [Leptolyngbya sp. FACHB-261]|uniref:prephenate/arogenate dehydrogenase n=1 Tax=Leptolyngbya sp. FACHB-261 TaxID=2692806 RepID=UPI00168764FA|nr:prephenate/arogenate dehydrogenase [Leptolyngbya sp. FACHB-261]MBD2104372.1 prephenate/arogenate dehydrogenase [Leptolyngbya sp. FACHB-261]
MSETPAQSIGIVGLGLIGGSLAMDFKALGHRVLAVARRSETCQAALNRQVVDEATTDLSLLQTAEVIFICTPLAAIEATVCQLVPLLKAETVLTDVGSVKAPVVTQIAPLWPNFVGGHPMAGTAEQGLEAAQAGLFQGRAYVLTPTSDTPSPALKTVTALAQSLGSRVYQCAPQAHDQAVAQISHLPVMVSASLIAACEAEPNAQIRSLAQQFASSGFRDTSRVGGGNPELGVLMARYNRESLLSALSQYRHCLDQVTGWIETENWSVLERSLSQTQQARPAYLDE